MTRGPSTWRATPGEIYRRPARGLYADACIMQFMCRKAIKCCFVEVVPAASDHARRKPVVF